MKTIVSLLARLGRRAAGQTPASPPSTLIEGFGARPCADYADVFTDAAMHDPALERERFGHAQWVLGYLSAWNVANPGRLKASHGVFGDDRERQDSFALSWVHDVCAAHPGHSVQAADDAFIAFRLRQEQHP